MNHYDHDTLCPLCSQLAHNQRQFQQTQMSDFLASIMSGAAAQNIACRSRAREIPYNVHLERSEVTTNG